MAKVESMDGQYLELKKKKIAAENKVKTLKDEVKKVSDKKYKTKKERENAINKAKSELTKAENQYNKVVSSMSDYTISSGYDMYDNNVGKTDASKGSVESSDKTEDASDRLAKKTVKGSFSSESERKKLLSSSLSLGDKMDDYSKYIYHSNNWFSSKELDIYNKTYRFGYFNTQTVSAGREFLFFTKPDLNIVGSDGKILPYYTGLSYWQDLVEYRRDLIRCLQISAPATSSSAAPSADYFNHLLQNQCISSLDIPGLQSSMIETATNDYGVGYSYRGSSEASDDNPEFSLEFKDTRWLDVFHFFKAYEYYETLKHHGAVAPNSYYIENRIIHDAFAIYKFIVAEDMETIIYWGKMYGVTPKSLPRDAFSNATFDNGITYSVDFQAAFYEDMIPDILADFNYTNREFYDANPYNIDIYNSTLDMSDGRPARAAMVKLYKSNMSPSGYVYKLKWRGSDLS